MKKGVTFLAIAIYVLIAGCDSNNDEPVVKDPDKAEIVSVDRFSDDAATLMKRSVDPGLPEANEPIDCDIEPFITKGLGPDGELVEYYNFDVQTLTPAPLWVLFREGEDTPVSGQMNIIDVIPGETGYNDFWKMIKVTVPSGYVANTVTSYDEIFDAGYELQPTTVIVNCPVVPQGSTATKRLGTESPDLDRGWYKGKVVYYFTFIEKDLEVNAIQEIPVSPIYVCFNINPDTSDPESGPVSGAKTETGSQQTHNVVETLPDDANYSPLWMVMVYDNAYFDQVGDLVSAKQALLLVAGAANVNCPVVSIN